MLAADDLGNTMPGRAYYSVALNAAREVADDQLTAIAHGHTAQLAATEGLTTASLDHLTAVHEHTQSAPAIASWIATSEATIHADPGGARRSARRARSALDQPGGRSAPASFHHGTAHLTATTGRVLLRVGDYSHAREVLTAALGDPRTTGRRHRILILVDLATAELHSGNPAAACSHATQAAELLHRTVYTVGTVPLVFAYFAPLPSSL